MHGQHHDPAFTRLSRRLLGSHVGQSGWRCPGDGPEHPAHPVAAGGLTLDHIVPLVEGGALLDRANLRVLCRARNSALGARLVNARRAGTTHTWR